MDKIEYPKWIYHTDGRALCVASLDEHLQYVEEGGWDEEPPAPPRARSRAKKEAEA